MSDKKSVMPSNIFSTYSTGENRITASILAVLRSLSLSRIERLLGALLEQSEFELVRFRNQVSGDGDGVPDAEIVSSCRILVETKRKTNSIGVEQLRRHLERLTHAPEATRILLVLTPDQQRPPAIEQLKTGLVTWASFSMFDQAIDELLADKSEVVSERESFLLRELQTMLLEEGLLGSVNDVLVVPARNAWPEYNSIHAYVCQPNRPFQPVKQMAFYCGGAVQPLVPTILKSWPSVRFERGKETGWLGDLISQLLESGPREEGSGYKVMQLSGPEDASTLKLRGAIENDLESASGRAIAFTQGQRYVSLEKLKTATRTSELLKD